MFLFDVPGTAPDLDRMMNEYGTGLMRLCYLYLKDYQLSQDAVQETFLRVFTKYSLFRSESSEKTWVTRIAMNVCRDMMRKRSYRDRGLEIPEFAPAESAGPEEQAMDMAENAELMRALEALPDIYRQTLLLYYYNGFKTDEIASILRTARSTVNVRLKRGRDMLRKALGDGDI